MTPSMPGTATILFSAMDFGETTQRNPINLAQVATAAVVVVALWDQLIW